MSLYKNIGCINFHSQTKWAEVFITDRHWLIQSKYLLPASESARWLASTCEKYNRCVKNNLLQVYSEAGKLPSLLMNRGEVAELEMESNNSIHFLCEICGILVRSLEAANPSQSILDIETGMFFRQVTTGIGFYLHLSQPHDSNQESHRNFCDSIINFIEKYFNMNHTPNKLLLTKLKRCGNLKQMKEQLQYFQNVYQIGLKKYQKQIKQSQDPTNTRTDQNHENKRVSHRRYRKRSQQIHEEHSSHHYSIPLPKKHSLDYRENNSKSRLVLNKNSQSLHQSQKRTTKIQLFSNRNKASQAVHSNSSSANRFKMMGSSKLSKDINRGMFSKKKIPTKNLKTKKMQEYSANKFQYSGTGQNTFNFTSNNNLNSLYADKVVHCSNKSDVRAQKNEKIISKHYDDLINSQKSGKQIKDDKTLKQVMANSLNVNKERNNKRESTHKLQSYHEEPSKSLKRKSKNERQSLKFVDQLWIQKLMEKSEEKQSQNFIEKKSTKNIQEVKNHQECKPQDLESLEKQKKYEMIFQEIQEIKLENQETIRPIEQAKKKIQIQQTNYKQTKLSSRDSQLKSQNSQINQICKQNQEHKQKQQKILEAEKQKTTRKKKIGNVNEILVNNLLKSLTCQIERINYVGQCVTSIPVYIKSLCSDEDDKYLWQLPAFILYKEFYIKRIQIEEKLKAQIHSQKITRPELTNLLKDIQDQNAETKESLAKLLKTTLKKMKKYEIEPRMIEQTKSFLNLDLTIRWSNRVSEIIFNFISELEELRQKKAKALSILIEICDAYCICNGQEFYVEERKKVCVAQYQKQQTIQYFLKKLEIVER